MTKNSKYSKLLHIALITLVVVVFGIYFASKIIRFQYQGYQSDLYTHQQIAQGWLEGRPLFYENCYGEHGKIHNYFLDISIGPFVHWWGVYGIFIFLMAFYVIAFFYSYRLLRGKDNSPYSINTLFFYLAFFCGPFVYYVFDNPHYGFHAEMMYVPLGLIFATALAKRDIAITILSGFAIVITKEDGPVVAACIHTLYATRIWLSGERNTRQVLYYILPRLALWVAVFFLGLWWLKHQNAGGGSRLDLALDHLEKQPREETYTYFKEIFTRFGILLLPLLAAFIWLRNFKFTIAIFILFLPIVLVNTISGLPYYPATFFSLTWVPRFSLVVGFMLAAMLFTIAANPKPWVANIKTRMWVSLIVSAALILSQSVVLQKQGYIWSKEAFGILKTSDPATYYPHYAQLKKLSKVLPDDYPIAPPFECFGYFHKKDIIWVNYEYNAYQKPRMLIYSKGTIEHKNLNSLHAPDSVITPDLWFYFEKEDGKYIDEAGIR